MNEGIKKVKLNKKVIIWSIVFFIIGFIVAPNGKVIEKEVVKACPKYESVVDLRKAILLYEQILAVDGEAFNIAADNIGLILPAAEAGMYQDIKKIEQITATLKANTAKVNSLIGQKTNLLLQIDLLLN